MNLLGIPADSLTSARKSSRTPLSARFWIWIKVQAQSIDQQRRRAEEAAMAEKSSATRIANHPGNHVYR